MEPITLTPIGRVSCTRRDPADDGWDAETTTIELDPARFDPEALAGLADFSHLEVVFFMHRVDPAKIETRARRPRNNPAWPRVGIFAQRGKNRPNQLGTTICRVLAVAGLTVRVAGLDAIDGTPVLDLKPWVGEFGPRGQVAQPEWMTVLMERYWG